jgi:L-asparaginase II
MAGLKKVKLTPIVQTTRHFSYADAYVESLHYGSVAVVDVAGNLRWFAGNPDQITLASSTLKPFQALPFVLDDGPERLRFTSDDLTLMCATHSGEDKHIQVIENMLNKIDYAECDLVCGSKPSMYGHSSQVPSSVRSLSQLHHGCSGKHAGYLAWCRLHGTPSQGYANASHRLQMRIRETLAHLAQVRPESIAVGVDICSAPNFALPLSRLAHMYARLAQGSRDNIFGSAMGDLFDAMTERSDLISCENDRLSSIPAEHGWVSKIGANSIQLIGIRSAGLGIAIKTSDCNAEVLRATTVSTLNQLSMLRRIENRQLNSYCAGDSDSKRPTMFTKIRPVFNLVRAPI